MGFRPKEDKELKGVPSAKHFAINLKNDYTLLMRYANKCEYNSINYVCIL